MSAPVEIVEDRPTVGDEGLILGLADAHQGTRVELVLSGGEYAHALLDPFAVEWQDLRVGDIVWVRPNGAARHPGPA
jgi:hypothetical protein